MKNLVIAAVAALSAMVAVAPASAQSFTGAHLGATVGYDKTHNQDGVTYGGAAGYDIAVAPRFIVGAEATLEDSNVTIGAIHASRDLAVSARAGYIVAPKTLVFAKVGYDTTRFEVRGLHANLEGVRFGGGIEYAVTPHTYISAEYRRTEYEDNFGGRDAGVVGVGYRF